MDVHPDRTDQLRWLFTSLYGADDRRATTERAVAWMATHGGPVVSTYQLAKVRNGQRNATHALLVGLAGYFQIPLSYWDNPVAARALRHDVADTDATAVVRRTALLNYLGQLPLEQLRTIEPVLETHPDPDDPT